jgi:hypothetical protein
MLVQDVGSRSFRRIGFLSFDGIAACGWKWRETRQKDLPEDCSTLLDECFHSNDIPRPPYEHFDENFMYTITLV